MTSTDPSGVEDARIIPGANSLLDGVDAAAGPIEPIWKGAGRPPAPGGAGRCR